MPEHARHPATQSTNEYGSAGSYQASVELFYHKEHRDHRDSRDEL